MYRISTGLGAIGAFALLGGSARIGPSTALSVTGALFVLAGAALATSAPRTVGSRRCVAVVSAALVVVLAGVIAARVPLHARWGMVSSGFEYALTDSDHGGNCGVRDGWTLCDDSMSTGFDTRIMWGSPDAVVFLASGDRRTEATGIIWWDGRSSGAEVRAALPELELVALGDGFSAFTADSWNGSPPPI